MHVGTYTIRYDENLQQIGLQTKIHPVYGAGILTHDLWNMSLLP